MVIVQGRARLSFRIARRRARVVFPRPGRWRYGVRIGRRTRLVGTVDVRPRRLSLREPFDVVETSPGTYLVADRVGNAVYRLRGGVLTRVARIAGARDLERAANGRVLVASGSKVVELDTASGHVQKVATAEHDVLGVAALPDGAIVVSDFGSRLVRFRDGRSDVLLAGLDGVHGLLSTDRGLVVCESSTGRVLRLARRGELQVLADGLELPSFAALAADGSLYVSEFGGGQITRIEESGARRTVATVPSPAGLSLASDGTILVASLTGRVARVDPATGRVTPLD